MLFIVSIILIILVSQCPQNKGITVILQVLIILIIPSWDFLVVREKSTKIAAESEINKGCKQEKYVNILLKFKKVR